MKTKRILTIFMLLCLVLSGCSSISQPQTDDGTISFSGDIAYYAAMDVTLLLNRHIELSGTVSSDGFTTLFIGEQSKDGITFSCTFAEHTKELESIRAGSSVRLHGICTSIAGNCIYLDGCELSKQVQTNPTNDSTTVSASTVPTTIVPTTLPATVPPTTVSPTTVPATTAPPTTPPPTTAPTTVPPTTVPPTTAPPATVSPTTFPTTPDPTEPLAGEILFVKWPETVSRNETAEVTIQGKPDTEYTITVYYKSGASTAKGLGAKTSDSNGYVTWTWKVGGKTSPGTFRIVVSGGGEKKTVNFTVISQ